MRTLVPYTNRPRRRIWQMMDDMRQLMPLDTDYDWFEGMPGHELALNIREDENDVFVETAMPGLKADEIDLRVTGRLLTLSAESRHELQEEEEGWHRHELRYGKVARTVELLADVDSNLAQADLEDGILTIRLPKTESSTIHKIAVRAKKLLTD